MKSRKKIVLIVASLFFVIAETTLAVLVQKIGGDANRIISYSSIVLACLFLSLFAERTWEYLFTQAALIMTLCADYFLVLLTDIKQFPAMIFFSVAQIAYFVRIYLSTDNKKVRIAHVAARTSIVILAIAITFIVLGKKADTVSVVSMFYFANLLVNIVFAMLQIRKNYILAIGLVLFACCDVLIGLSCIECYLEIVPGTFVYRLAHPGYNLAWMFYIPSQMLIALSLLPQKLKKLK